jgi:unsaturated rhamnogalacturonyl hydrolase
MLQRMVQTTEAYPYRVWGFGESIAMQALLAMDSPHAAHLLDAWARTAPALAGEPLAHVAPGVPVLERYATTHEPVLLDRALELAAVLASTHVGQHGARIHRPDLAGWQHEVWVDCMHLDGPFLAVLANVSNDCRWRDLAVDLLLSHAGVLQDERTGLFSHGFDDLAGEPNGVFWGRGQGWALLGLLDTLLALPADQPEIHQRLTALVDALARCECASGCWHTVVDVPATYVESSVSAFVALAVGLAITRGVLDAKRYAPLAQRSLDATRAALDEQGALRGVSDATPVGRDADQYARRPLGVFPWGQGPALLALAREVR